MEHRAYNEHLTAVDLFCGAGGLTLGLREAGFNVLAGIEVEEAPASTYRMNHSPATKCIQKDIREVSAKDILSQLGLRKGELGLLAGCPPCQGFSTLRTRKKALTAKDDRNDLLFEFLRMVEEIAPKAIMMENVPALALDSRMKRFLKSLKQLGYFTHKGSVSVVNAANYGVPQRRKRMILVASKAGWVEEAEKTDQLTVRQSLERANLKPVGKAGDPLHDYIHRRSERVKAVIRNIPKDGGSRGALPEDLTLDCHKRAPLGFRDVYGRMAWDKVAPTITGGCGNPSKGRYLHPEEDRAISLREAAILQTFPVDYKFDLSMGRDRVALMIGNALPPEFIKRHAEKIAAALTAP